jgi:hypothetical protein
MRDVRRGGGVSGGGGFFFSREEEFSAISTSLHIPWGHFLAATSL